MNNSYSRCIFCGKLFFRNRWNFFMPLVAKEKSALKAKAHALKPIVLIGDKGLSANVEKEIERGLRDHELMKVRIHGQDREFRKNLFNTICQSHAAELIGIIGNIAILYRKNPDQ